MTNSVDPIPKLMAVDDDVASAELVVRIAERCGFQAFATSDPRGVTMLARTLKPEMMAVDICMPNIDANSLFELLKEENYQGEIILVSGQDHMVLHKTAEYGRSLGLKVPYVLQKPLPIQELRSILNTFREKQAA